MEGAGSSGKLLCPSCPAHMPRALSVDLSKLTGACEQRETSHRVLFVCLVSFCVSSVPSLSWQGIALFPERSQNTGRCCLAEPLDLSTAANDDNTADNDGGGAKNGIFF